MQSRCGSRNSGVKNGADQKEQKKRSWQLNTLNPKKKHPDQKLFRDMENRSVFKKERERKTSFIAFPPFGYNSNYVLN